MVPFSETPRFNTEIRYGTVGGPEFNTDIMVVTSGAESRNANWLDSRGKWQVADDVFNKKEIDELIAFFRERKGRAGGFRFKDWSDWRVEKTEGVLLPIAGMPGRYQLAKQYVSGGQIVRRPITKPVPHTVKVYEGGVTEFDTSSQTAGSVSNNLLVLTAYAAIGRRGIGADADQADQNGIDFWMKALTEGSLTPDAFIPTFLYGASTVDTTGPAAAALALLTTIKATVGDPYYVALVLTAYAALGRTGMGIGADQIDSAGYEYWMSILQSGQAQPEDFLAGFFHSAQTFTPSTIDYSGQVPVALAMIQQISQLPVDTPTLAYYGTIVLLAYGAVGRTGFGPLPENIDVGGFNFWLTLLLNGSMVPEQVFEQVMAGTIINDAGTSRAFRAQTLLDEINAITTLPVYYAALVTIGFAAIDRIGFGSLASNVDTSGFNFWLTRLTGDYITPERFPLDFLNAAARYSSNVGVDYSDQIAMVNDLLASLTTLVGSTGYLVDPSNGVVTLPSSNFSWSGEFDVPARFDTDTFTSTFEGYRPDSNGRDGESMFTVQGLSIVEIRVELLTGKVADTTSGSSAPPPIVMPPPVLGGSLVVRTPSPNAVFQISTTPVSGHITSGLTTEYSSLGSGTYTYSWVRVSGSTSITAVSATSATTAFIATMSSGTLTATFKCTVSDGVDTFDSPVVTVSLTAE